MMNKFKYTSKHLWLAVISAALSFSIGPASGQSGLKPTLKEKYVYNGSGNPYLPLWEHLPDGEPRVFEDPDNSGKYRAYIIGSHDVRFTSYCGADIRMWSAPVENLSSWRDEGAIFSYQLEGQWDVMYAPDLVEVKRKDGKKDYYLYPHSRGQNREAVVAKGSRPDGPFSPINLTDDGKKTVPGSILGFDPAVFIEYVTDPKDPDFEIGFRAYAYWGFQRSLAAELDQKTMYSVRPGTKVIERFIPSSAKFGVLRDPASTSFPYIYPTEDLGAFNFFEASSIRKVGNKFVSVYSGYSGPEYGMGSSNSTLRYLIGDSPLGPWKSGGVLVDSRAPVLNQDGSAITGTNAGHNTHGSIQEINGQWYVFYHRPPRGFGFARQAMVAPVSVSWDQKPVAEGGSVRIGAYDPFSMNKAKTVSDTNGLQYKGAEVTSEGFNFFGLDPYKFYSAGYASYLSNIGSMQDAWDIWDNHMPVTRLRDKDIVGFKYFGFGGLKQDVAGLKAFKGTSKGNNTIFNLFIKPKTNESFKVNVWLDGPWDNATWKGKKIGEIVVPSNAGQQDTRFTINVARYVDHLEAKHAIYLVAEGTSSGELFDLTGIGFSTEKNKISRPVVPQVKILSDRNPVELPVYPLRSTNENGLMGFDTYRAVVILNPDRKNVPLIKATSNDPAVKISVSQASSLTQTAQVKFDYKGLVKTYQIVFETL